MDKGRIVYDGPSAALRDDPENLARLVGIVEAMPARCDGDHRMDSKTK
jgi:hypothetical protein